MTALLA
jgi:hypothetical protein